MASTLSQATEMFRSIDSANTGLISRDDLKIVMQEIGGEMWAGESFDTMLEACGVAPGSGEVKFGAFLEQLLGGVEDKKPEAAKEDSPKEAKSAPAAQGAPSRQDCEEAETIVQAVCGRILASMKEGPASGAPPSLFLRLGSAPAVDAAVEKFYEKVVADELLKPIFEAVPMSGLKAMQKKFLTMAFGGPNDYSGRSLREAHQGKGISDAHFDAVAGHLAATLKELGVADADLGEAMAIAASTRGDIVEAMLEGPAAAA